MVVSRVHHEEGGQKIIDDPKDPMDAHGFTKKPFAGAFGGNMSQGFDIVVASIKHGHAVTDPAECSTW